MKKLIPMFVFMIATLALSTNSFSMGGGAAGISLPVFHKPILKRIFNKASATANKNLYRELKWIEFKMNFLSKENVKLSLQVENLKRKVQSCNDQMSLNN